MVCAGGVPWLYWLVGCAVDSDYVWGEKVKRISTLVLMVVALASLGVASPAYAHATGTSSDDSGNGHIELCNNQDVIPGRLGEAIRDWNGDPFLPRPVINNVTGFGIKCEVKIIRRDGDGEPGPGSNYATTYYWTDKPDELILYSPFFVASKLEKDHTIRHELGHTLGLEHNQRCGESVMATTSYCNSQNTSVRGTKGPHDVEDLRNYWNGATPIYPNESGG